MILYLLISLPFLLLAACFFLPTIRFFEARPEILIGITVLLFVIEPLFPMDLLPAINLGGISVYPLDVVCPVLLAFVFPFIYSKLKLGFKREDLPFVCFLVWGIFLAVSFLLGVKQFGIQVATNEFRGYLYIVCVGSFVSTLDIKAVWPKIEKFWLFGAFALMLIGLSGYTDGDLSRAGRPLDSTPTLFLLQAVVISIFMYVRGKLDRRFIPFCLMLFPMLVLLQHRSVWIVCFLALGIIFWTLPQARGMMIKCGSIGLIVCGTFAVVVFGEQLFEALSDSYNEAVTTRTDKNTSTFVWRLQGWTGLLNSEQTSSVKKILIGNPFGTGWNRVVMTSDGVEEVRTESPHNYYIQTFLRCGIFGLFAFVGVHLFALRHLYFRASLDLNLRPILLCLFILIACQMVFYTVYGSNHIQAILLGAAIAYLRQTRQLEHPV